MKTLLLQSISLTILLIAPSSSAQAGDSPDHNPFEWPRAERDGNPAAATEQSLPTVRAVMNSSGFKAANIDGQLLREGERIHGYQLLRIDEGGVVLRRNATEYAIAVYQGEEPDDD